MKPETMKFRSHGKLLLTGEYMVMFGAGAFAMPVRPGQSLTVSAGLGRPVIRWTANQKGKTWFSATISYRPWKVLETVDKDTAIKLLEMMQAGSELNPGCFSGDREYEMVSELEFDRSWGLGSSSTLISNLAYWLECDPFSLYRKVACGSGYDIATARSGRPILFRLVNGRHSWEEIPFRPAFSDRLFFIYQGTKQDTARGLDELLHRPQPGIELIRRVDKCTERAIQAPDIDVFEESLREHEALVAGFLDKTPVARERFADFRGMVKSLGAWGGDFVLASHGDDPDYVEDYFRRKNLFPIFRFDELVL